ncbi:hypothetical protein Nepgr_004129 [Nepenthes gracilis]|uniref:Transmembrane protein n=1 Tax=Nepenthes gracilis TaxID=150966 RepID=A0AAD3S0S0_NEPGR|nr:hypothetical protein Nepgr_004129 [Nepenthes gracilis]
MAPRESTLEAGLECGGGTTSGEGGHRDYVLGGSQGKKKFARVFSGILRFYGSNKGEHDIHSGSKRLATFQRDAGENIEIVIEKNPGDEKLDGLQFIEKTNPKEKRIKPNSKRPPKPPRPPKGPLLNASDLKLMREISELTAKKRARIERMKALGMMRSPRRSPSSSSLIAMVVTILFFAVIILQGLCSRNNFWVRRQMDPFDVLTVPWRGSSGSKSPLPPLPEEGIAAGFDGMKSPLTNTSRAIADKLMSRWLHLFMYVYNYTMM